MDDLTRRAIAAWTRAVPAVSAFVFALVPDRAERDDVLQEVAIAVLESFARYDPARPFLPWAMAIARNTVVSALRARQRRPSLPGPEALDALAAAVDDVAGEEQAKLQHLARCLEQLGGRARQLCELRYQLGLKPAQIAARLGLLPNTVAKALQRVREILRGCIEGRMDPDPGVEP